MKILHLNYSDNNGGAARAAYRIHKALVDEGINSIFLSDEVAAENKSTSISLNIIESLQRKFVWKTANLFKILLGRSYRNNKNFGLFPSPWLKKINSINADIVHLHWPGREILSIKQISKINAEVVWTFHDLWPILGTSHLPDINSITSTNKTQKCVMHKIIESLVMKSKLRNWKQNFAIVTPSKSMENRVRETNIFKNNTIKTIPHPINLQEWKPMSKKVVREELSISDDEKVILFGAYGGIEDQNKGFSYLEKALMYLSKNNKNKFRLIVFGSKTDISLKIKNIPVTSFDYINNNIFLNKLYSASDVFAMPSYFESFGQTALESLCCGTPVVAFSDNGIQDIVTHKKNGYIVSQNNPNKSLEFASGLKWALTEEIDTFSDHNELLIKKFDNSNIARQYIKMYYALLRNTKNIT